jgi:hypothetical protein
MYCRLGKLADGLNRMPMKAIGFDFPVEKLKGMSEGGD